MEILLQAGDTVTIQRTGEPVQGRLVHNVTKNTLETLVQLGNTPQESYVIVPVQYLVEYGKFKQPIVILEDLTEIQAQCMEKIQENILQQQFPIGAMVYSKMGDGATMFEITGYEVDRVVVASLHPDGKRKSDRGRWAYLPEEIALEKVFTLFHGMIIHYPKLQKDIYVRKCTDATNTTVYELYVESKNGKGQKIVARRASHQKKMREAELQAALRGREDFFNK